MGQRRIDMILSKLKELAKVGAEYLLRSCQASLKFGGMYSRDAIVVMSKLM